jgi:acetolactate synthase I/II/III large subunit
MKRRTGGEALCSALERLGVEHVFGVPGTQNIALFEALRRSSLRTILATHELAAGFMANGYYRGSGKVGVLTTIPGPGFAFTIAAIAEAAQDSSALLYIVGKAGTIPGRKFNLQQIDQRAILAPLVKRTIEVDDPADIVSAACEAYDLATAGEPGPVALEVADRAIEGEVPGEPSVDRHGTPRLAPPPDSLDDLIRMLAESRRAVLFVGQGVNEASAPLRELAELLDAPLIATRSARGALGEDHRLALAADFSSSAVRALNSILDGSDLILALGCKFTHNGTYGFQLHFPKEKLIHVEASSDVLNANYPARLAILADAPLTIQAILGRREALARRQSAWDQPELARLKQAGRPDGSLPEPRIHGVDPPTPAAFFAALRRAMPSGACLVTDSGWHQVLATRHFRVLGSRGLIIPSDFQSMGFGLPAAIAAKLAVPEKRVVALIGDGGLAMSGMELLPAVRERIPITVIVFNDGALGQIRIQQLSSFGHAHATELETPDLSLFAEAVGAAYVRLESDAEQTLRAAIHQDGVTLVEVNVGDTAAIRVARAKGLARRTAKHAFSPSLLRWIKSKVDS